MSYEVKGTGITLTRGDSVKIKVQIVDKEGNLYIPDPKDVIEFGVKKEYSDEELLIHKFVSPDDLILRIEPEDTKLLDFGIYLYDMQLTKPSGEVSTFITKAKIKITEEVC